MSDGAPESFGETLRRLREEAELSQPRLAEKVPISQASLSRYENGKQIPARSVAAGLDELLGADGHLLAAFDATPRVRLPEGPDGGRLGYVASRPGAVDRTCLDTLAGTLAHWRRLDDSLGAEAVLPSVMTTLALVEHIVRDARGGIRPAVLDVGAQWLQFAGWLSTTTKRHDKARAVQDRMLEWAMELGSPDLVASALSTKGHHAWTLGAYGPMVGLSEAARRDRRASPAILATAAQQQARGHSLLGQADAAERLLDRADDLAVAAAQRPDLLPPWLYFHSTDLLVLQRGLAYKYLAENGVPGYRRKAVETLNAGLNGLDRRTRASEWISWYVRQRDETAHVAN
ncbi:helix-turn-helix transcriptional regulator [Pseudonocardia acaciae]|uniref:helix-turn-helix transcriptional regulator n=1 Tax=Pseudonocardia acaciae TaxID=551276 RepID=UPI00068582BE|nr:helix-turn-helix transcriptional regulator [Pseudonocardia acaciae]